MDFIKKENKVFYKSMLVIALPVIIQHIISIGLNMIDTIMISQLGVDAVSAVGLANRVYFIFSIVCFGIYSGASIFVAQYWGVKDVVNIKKVFGIDIFMGSILSIVLSIVVFLFPKQILRVFIDNTDVISFGAEYLRVVSFSYFFTAISFAYSFNCRAIHKLAIPTAINALALCINTVLNYILINGKLGFPAYGVSGAAIATVIARFIEFILMIFFVYKEKNHPLAGTLKELMSWDLSTMKNVLKTSMPVILAESTWGIGTTIYYIAYGFLGSNAVAVVQVSTTISDFFQALFFGVGSACAVMIGNELGKNNLDNAYEYGKKYIKITLILNIIFSILLFLFKGLIIDFYNFDADTNILLNKTLIIFSLYFTPKMFTYVFICGILRAGGDTKFCMFLEVICIWFIGVPLSFFSVLVLKLPIHLVLAVVFSEELIKLIVVIKRFASKKWINNLIS